ncbi:hypothetical protein BMS3Abin12_00764 [bacterium BMS3Abin12]|nr:hypothetical protein BMS3Abin12_00764 [bacterium BMS3Abin12]
MLSAARTSRPTGYTMRATLRLIFLVALFTLCMQLTQASGVAFQTGDVFAGVGNGEIEHFRPDGTLVDTLNTGAAGTEDTGMAFDVTGSLYATVFEANNLYEFNNKGDLIGLFGGDYNLDPESIVFNNKGDAYVGQADGSGEVLKFDPTGALLDSYSPQRESRGTDWIDLAADQCTLHYTSEGTSIKQYNVCTKTQLPDFATGLNGPCYAHRIRPNGEELVACTSQIYRLNSSGVIIQTYHLPGTTLLFALNLDPDNKSFWTADLFSGVIFRLNIATGATMRKIDATVLRSLGGLSVAGEITAAVTTASPFTTSYYVTTTRPAHFFNKGSELADKQINRQRTTGAVQDNVVALLFRAPYKKNGQYGVRLYGKFLPISTITELAEDFVVGYYKEAATHPALHVRIIISTSNGTLKSGNYVDGHHGYAWAKMVNTVATWIVTKGYSGQVDVAGGSDMETDGGENWASASDTRAWVDGYALVHPQRFLYDLGDANGCPPQLRGATTSQTATSQPCKNGWSQDDVWYVSWGANPAMPLPEIYWPHMAREWAQLSLYGYLNPGRRNGGSMVMSGALTQSQACHTNPGADCDPKFITPAYGWNQLYNALNADNHTAQSTLPWSTDMSWGLGLR